MCKLGFCDQKGDVAVSFGFVQMQLYLIIMAVAQGLFQPEKHDENYLFVLHHQDDTYTVFCRLSLAMILVCIWRGLMVRQKIVNI